MRPIKYLFLFLLIFLILQGCSLGFLDSTDNEETEAADYFIYDNQTDTGYYYNGNDTLLWHEEYDFDDQGQCIFIKHLLPSGTVLWSYVYTWSDGHVTTEAYFDSENQLSWYNHLMYTGDNVVQVNNYSKNETLQWFTAYKYSGTDKETQVTRFNGSGDMQWAYSYTYDGSDRVAVSSAYGTDGNRTAYINSDYDSSGNLIKKTGYGSTQSSDTFSGAFEGFSFPITGGVNTQDRNTQGLTAPVPPEAPAVPSVALTDDTFTGHRWMSLWVYDSFGYSLATLNDSYLPVYFKREAPDYLNNRPIEVELTYGAYGVASKTTTYNSQEVLKLEFGYNTSGYLTSLNTTGMSLYIPLRYEFTYLAGGIPESISIHNGSTLLQRFVYEYPDTYTPSDPHEFAKNVHTIRHYDGDDVEIGYYVFTYNDATQEITITVMDSRKTTGTEDDISTGYFLLSYDADGNTAGFASFDDSGTQVWDYRYSYDEFDNRIAETRLDKDDIPEVVSTFDVESLFEDLKRFLP